METESRNRVEKVSIDHLDPNPYQTRQIDETSLEGLMESIRAYGFMGHLEARHNPWNPTGKLQLVYGHRRVRACELLGIRTVPVKIVERTDEQMRLIVLIENETIEPLTYWEQALHFDTLHKSGLSLNDIAKAIGKSKGYVQARLDLMRLPEGPLREAAMGSQVEMSALSVLLTLEGNDKEELLDAVKRGEVNASTLRALRSARHRSVLPKQQNELGNEVSVTYDKGTTVHVVHNPEPAEPPVEGIRFLRPVDGILTPVEEDFAEDRVLPGYQTNSLTIQPLTPLDWAQRALVQMRNVLPILRDYCDKADFSMLSTNEREELRACSREVVDLLDKHRIAV